MANENWRKIEEEITRFEKKGDTVEGVLVKKEKSSVYDNEVYHIMTADDIKRVVFGTSVLSSKLASVTEGDQVRIIFTGTQPNKKAGQNDIKLFDVFVR